jgi:hypothetical protein
MNERSLMIPPSRAAPTNVSYNPPVIMYFSIIRLTYHFTILIYLCKQKVVPVNIDLQSRKMSVAVVVDG